MDPDPSLLIFSFFDCGISFILLSIGMSVSLFLLLVLIVFSGLISGSEIAFFSLTPNQVQDLTNDNLPSSKLILDLREKPRKLLATILIANNLVNISIVIVSDFVIKELLGDDVLLRIGTFLFENGFAWLGNTEWLASAFNLLITVIGVTSILVLFGEIAPKIYANLNNVKTARMMSKPLALLNYVFGPFSRILVEWSKRIENRVASNSGYQTSTSKEDIDAAIDLAVNNDQENSEEEADILKSIVKFGDVAVKQIMKSRVDVVALDINSSFKQVMDTVKESGYSRIPVYSENFDSIEGVLYVKDLIGYTAEKKDFDWVSLIRKTVLYVPEFKKIDDLLKEFQKKRNHLAIVVDEYGGSSGIVTLEDVMEEVIGDIKDEFDEGEDIDFVKLDDGVYIFEGKTMLNDVCRIIGVDTSYFDDIKGDSDTLAGIIIEVKGFFPKIESEMEYRDVILKIVALSDRRIEKIHLRLKK